MYYTVTSFQQHLSIKIWRAKARDMINVFTDYGERLLLLLHVSQRDSGKHFLIMMSGQKRGLLSVTGG